MNQLCETLTTRNNFEKVRAYHKIVFFFFLKTSLCKEKIFPIRSLKLVAFLASIRRTGIVNKINIFTHFFACLIFSPLASICIIARNSGVQWGEPNEFEQSWRTEFFLSIIIGINFVFFFLCSQISKQKKKKKETDKSFVNVKWMLYIIETLKQPTFFPKLFVLKRDS